MNNTRCWTKYDKEDKRYVTCQPNYVRRGRTTRIVKGKGKRKSKGTKRKRAASKTARAAPSKKRKAKSKDKGPSQPQLQQSDPYDDMAMDMAMDYVPSSSSSSSSAPVSGRVEPEIQYDDMSALGLSGNVKKATRKKQSASAKFKDYLRVNNLDDDLPASWRKLPSNQQKEYRLIYKKGGDAQKAYESRIMGDKALLQSFKQRQKDARTERRREVEANMRANQRRKEQEAAAREKAEKELATARNLGFNTIREMNKVSPELRKKALKQKVSVLVYKDLIEAKNRLQNTQNETSRQKVIRAAANLLRRTNRYSANEKRQLTVFKRKLERKEQEEDKRIQKEIDAANWRKTKQSAQYKAYAAAAAASRTQEARNKARSKTGFGAALRNSLRRR